MSDVVKTHAAVEIAAMLGKDYKTVLNLIKRGHLRALPGLRHKLITEVISHLTFAWEASFDSARRCYEKFMRTEMRGGCRTSTRWN